jgi:hypothetical protein
MILQLVFGEGLTTPHHKIQLIMNCYCGALDFDGLFGMTKTMENWYEIWNIECCESL